ncbi:MAG TPA: type IV pilus modification protein PilV [Gammaproteobacteria bacterium]|jgi:type IV pilus assembly protein PilV|nr:type IV pilus modification protein PilV [Chromatiales bacterium]HJP39332.1 type IV pilus modification protein PilV [Gammaproteobacteria bacterium]
MERIRNSHQTGFTLVEAMVSLVVLAVGMLGVAAMYIESLRSGHMSVSYTNAVTLAADMADRIRANSLGIHSYAGTGVGNGTAGSNNNCVNGLVDCASALLAADDLFWWYEDIKNLMPVNRSATVAVVNVPPLDQYTITLTWPERGQPQPVSYVLTFRQ